MMVRGVHFRDISETESAPCCQQKPKADAVESCSLALSWCEAEEDSHSPHLFEVDRIWAHPSYLIPASTYTYHSYIHTYYNDNSSTTTHRGKNHLIKTNPSNDMTHQRSWIINLDSLLLIQKHGTAFPTPCKYCSLILVAFISPRASTQPLNLSLWHSPCQ